MRSIEVTFPVDLEFTDEEHSRFCALLQGVCDRYVLDHPDRVCWVFGQGDKCTYMPMTQAEEEAGFEPQFDDSIFSVEIAEREAYPQEVERNLKRKARFEEKERAELARLSAKYSAVGKS